MKLGSEVVSGLGKTLYNPFSQYMDEAKRRYEEYLKQKREIESMPGGISGAVAGLTLNPHTDEKGITTSPLTDPLFPHSQRPGAPMGKTGRLPALPVIPELPGPVAPVAQGVFHSDREDLIDATEARPPFLASKPFPTFEVIPGKLSEDRHKRENKVVTRRLKRGADAVARRQNKGNPVNPFANAKPLKNR